ncbi:response regulator [Bradyrhizobium sp. ISRA443]|uniref:response regulator n=1 Tax=unclassified Bradyrhizobium TaxID=2631580 RepID=UPI00247AE604|nr:MULTISPECIES: response regulator [unclassified Bradyrhizobium]WGR94528.1 response regulator [Bradyrhizobium sp. ISRA435]WGR99276.1 response regulator [Bradyrhizobium sp. ISRA436]WGS06168.1 response regulator [Bradyrhizobium sp. ISRA437]WGS13053.1 response regulator [Bradyrhizobium sp. ISRA443]
MTALAQSIVRAFSANSLQITVIRNLFLLALAVLFVAILRATYGLDLGPGFF